MIILPKIYTRDFPLLLLQIWGKRYRSFFGTKIDIFPRNICIFRNGVWDAYRHPALNGEINAILLKKIIENPAYVESLFLQAQEKIQDLRNLCMRTDLSQKEFMTFIDFLLEAWDSLYVALHIPSDKRFSEEDRDLAFRFRKGIDQFEYQAFNHVRTILRTRYPDFGSQSDFLMLEEVSSGNIPSLSSLALRKKEKLILVDDMLTSSSEFDELQVKFDFRLEESVDVSDMSEFPGQVACFGVVRGRVRRVIKNEDMKSFRDGEVLVSPMTIPTFLPIMKRAIAFVTDEGGITCHAAIVAREMKKPCIIGTKIATQVLHDGDLVEVDADRGVVRVIERVSDALYNKDTHWTHYLTRPFTLFGASLWQEWYNSPETLKVLGSQMKNALFIEQVTGVARNYRKYDELEDHKRYVKTLCEQNEQQVIVFLEEGVLLNQEAKKYLSGEMKFVDIASAMDFLICLSLRATILPYWVIAFSEDITYQDTQLLTLAEDIRSVSLYPNLVSQVIIPLAEEELHARGLDPSVLPYMTLQELLSGAAEVASQRMSLSHRRKFFVYQVLDGAENVSFVSDPAAVIATLEHVDDHDGVRGQTVFQGNVKGIARIVYSIDEKKEFNMGDILVSINSNPSLLPLIHKCGAIITDEGGIMCHAAIVAREMKKPCIIGTKIATQVLHDGDLVEVDADHGVVMILERASSAKSGVAFGDGENKAESSPERSSGAVTDNGAVRIIK
ncbi:MAG: hypothetical protein IPJ68_03265 [Candidatus Moraniibacteriota bacterium]|nr:MAG: hypothetical protein IPJ68_03265 [Candidatus Moranbacteria bacterium]